MKGRDGSFPACWYREHNLAEKKYTILVVDDAPDNLDTMKLFLRNKYHVTAALNSRMALKAMEKVRPDLILLDVMMPGMDGVAFCRLIKSDPMTRDIPVIFVSTSIGDEERGIKAGGVDYITKPVNPSMILLRVDIHLALSRQKLELKSEVEKKTRELVDTQYEIIKKLSRAAEYKDNETGDHVLRVGLYARGIGRYLGMDESDVDNLFHAAPMHDIGKIGIPDHILLKPGKLDPEEWEIMKSHTSIGGDIIGGSSSPLLEVARIICLEHHEKWNGMGYPEGKQGRDISLYARIVAVCDVFDALVSERPYKKAWPEDRALALIKEERGVSFDPAVADAFATLFPQLMELKENISSIADTSY
jgi:putative two-component system response regulator